MKIDLKHTQVKRRRTIYYVECLVQFNAEEQAIVREKEFLNYELTFENFVNLPPGADTSVDPAYLRTASRLLFLAGFPLVFFVPPLGLISWATSIALFFWRKNIENLLVNGVKHTITVKEIMGRPFSVAGFGTALTATVLEADARGKIHELKHLLDAAVARRPVSQSYEL